MQFAGFSGVLWRTAGGTQCGCGSRQLWQQSRVCACACARVCVHTRGCPESPRRSPLGPVQAVTDEGSLVDSGCGRLYLPDDGSPSG